MSQESNTKHNDSKLNQDNIMKTNVHHNKANTRMLKEEDEIENQTISSIKETEITRTHNSNIINNQEKIRLKSISEINHNSKDTQPTNLYKEYKIGGFEEKKNIEIEKIRELKDKSGKFINFKPMLSERNFLDGNNEELNDYKCSYCNGIFYKPIMDICGHVICTPCYEELVKHSTICPISGMDILNSMNSVPIINRFLSNRSVKCMNDPCMFTGTLGNYYYHIDNDCKYTEAKCIYENCKEKLTKNDLAYHLENCIHRKVLCDYCSKEFSIVKINYHLENTCPYYLIECPKKCGESFQRINYNKHLETCDNSSVDCPLIKIGCTDRVIRMNLKKHIDEEISKHSILMLNSVCNLNEKIDNRFKQVEEFRNKTAMNKNVMTENKQINETELIKRKRGRPANNANANANNNNNKNTNTANNNTNTLNNNANNNNNNNNNNDTKIKYIPFNVKQFINLPASLTNNKEKININRSINDAQNHKTPVSSNMITEKNNNDLELNKPNEISKKDKEILNYTKKSEFLDTANIDNKENKVEINKSIEDYFKSNSFTKCIVPFSELIFEDESSSKNIVILEESEYRKEFKYVTEIFCSSSENTHQFALATDSSDTSTRHDYYKIKLEKSKGFIAFGVCKKQSILNSNFQFYGNEKNKFNHSCFGISNNGYSWNCSNSSQDNIKLKNGCLKEGDEIFVEVDGVNEYVKFYRENELIVELSNVCCDLDIYLVPYVILVEKNDTVVVSYQGRKY